MSEKNEALQLADALEISSNHGIRRKAAAELRRQYEEITELRHGAGVANQTIADLVAQRDALLAALHIAEAALSDIGDADREPGDDVAWCEARAAEAIPKARAAIKAVEGAA